MNFTLRALRSGVVGFVNHEDIRDLHDARLDGLYVVAHPWNQHHDCHLRHTGDLNFVLTHPHRFDDDEVLAGRVHQRGHIGGSPRQPAGCSARGHGADEDAGVGVMAEHADAVAQDRAAGAPAGGVHRDDGGGASLAAQLARHGIHQRALARARRTGDADHHRVSGARLQLAQHFQRPRIAILDPRGGAGQRARIAFRNFARPIRHRLFKSCRAITSRCISLVPSPMVQSFTSR